METGYLKVINNTVVPKNMPRLTAGSFNTINIIWEFPEIWQNYKKRATFSINGNITYVQVVDNCTVIPRLNSTGRLDIGCYLYEDDDENYTAICSASPYTCYVSNGSYSEDITENTESAQRYVQAAGEYAQQALDTKNRIDQLVTSLNTSITQAYSAQNYLDEKRGASIEIAGQLEQDISDGETLLDELGEIITAEADLRNSLQSGNLLLQELTQTISSAEDTLEELSIESDFVRQRDLQTKADKTDLNTEGFRYHHTLSWNIQGQEASTVVLPTDNSNDTLYFFENLPLNINFTAMVIPKGTGIGYTYNNFRNPISLGCEIDRIIIHAAKQSDITAAEINAADFSQTVRYYTMSQIDALFEAISEQIPFAENQPLAAGRSIINSNNIQSFINTNEVTI